MKLSLLILLALIVLLLVFSPSVRGQGDEEGEEYEDEGGLEAEEESDAPPTPPPSYTHRPPSPDRAKLILHKRLITPIPGVFAAHQPINVSILCHNVGKTAAHSITIGDNWGDLFDITEGTNSTEIDILEAEETVHLNFTVVPLKEGHFTGGAATVTYSAEGEGSRLQQGYSAGYKSFTVYPQDVYEKYARSKWLEWLILGLGSLAVVGLPAAVWTYIQTNYQHGLPISSKKSA